MAKPHANKHAPKTADSPTSNSSTDEVKAGGEAVTVASDPKPTENSPAASGSKKESPPTRVKKQPASKTGSLLPSAYKLEQLKAAVTAAGNAEQLLLILNYVEEAGGRAEVVESIEAYRVLKTVLED